MPTISELPSSSTVSAADEIPISQGGTAKAVSVGALLASTQPAIVVAPSSLIGRNSVGAGGPEQIDIGLGIGLSGGTLAATGLDHAAFPALATLDCGSDLVISNQGNPMLLQTSLLRGLFSAGHNVTIDSNGTISATAPVSTSSVSGAVDPISCLPVVTALASQDLVAVSQSGSDSAIAFSDFLGGLTIDQAQAAVGVGDADTIWVAQGSNVMLRQSFAGIWTWICSKLLAYKYPVVEISANTNLDATLHNGRTLICSQPVTLTPVSANMGSGFHCTVMNASSGAVLLGAGFITSTGSFTLSSWQAAEISCLSYSAGTISFAAMPGTTLPQSVPSQVTGLSSTSITSTTVSATWQTPTSGGVPSSYVLQYRPTGTSTWVSSQLTSSPTSYQITGLQAGTSYDLTISAGNSAGIGAPSAVLTVSTQSTTPSATSVTSITWNLIPSGTYTHGSGAVGINAQVNPATAPIQFGFSQSPTTRPSSWTAAVLVNTNLWGVYAPTPSSAGTWYAWAEGLDGSAATVSLTPFFVQ